MNAHVSAKGLNIIDVGRQFFGPIPRDKLFAQFFLLYQAITEFLRQNPHCQLNRDNLNYEQFFFKASRLNVECVNWLVVHRFQCFVLFARNLQPTRNVSAASGRPPRGPRQRRQQQQRGIPTIGELDDSPERPAKVPTPPTNPPPKPEGEEAAADDGSLELRDEERKEFCRLLTRIEFPFQVKIWNLLRTCRFFRLHNNPEMEAALVEAVRQGTIS